MHLNFPNVEKSTVSEGNLFPMVDNPTGKGIPGNSVHTIQI